MRHFMLAGGAVVVIAACGGNGSGGTAPGGGGGGGSLVHAMRVTAKASPLVFDPDQASIPAGDTIFFTFQGVQHNVKFDTQGNPGDVPTTSNATVKRQFLTAGTYSYHCSIHAQMTGTITVTP